MKPRNAKRDAYRADGAAGDLSGARLSEAIRKRVLGEKHVHIIGEHNRTWCDVPIIHDGRIKLADTKPQATCETCIELDDHRRAGLANGTYRTPEDLKMDKELGDGRPMTLGT